MTFSAQALSNQGNVLSLSLAFDAPPSALQQSTLPADQQDYIAFELANATILAASLGLGVYVDAFI